MERMAARHQDARLRRELGQGNSVSKYWKQNIKLFKADDFIAELSRQNTNISYVATGYIPTGPRERLIKMEVL